MAPALRLSNQACTSFMGEIVIVTPSVTDRRYSVTWTISASESERVHVITSATAQSDASKQGQPHPCA